MTAALDAAGPNATLSTTKAYVDRLPSPATAGGVPSTFSGSLSDPSSSEVLPGDPPAEAAVLPVLAQAGVPVHDAGHTAPGVTDYIGGFPSPATAAYPPASPGDPPASPMTPWPSLCHWKVDTSLATNSCHPSSKHCPLLPVSSSPMHSSQSLLTIAVPPFVFFPPPCFLPTSYLHPLPLPDTPPVCLLPQPLMGPPFMVPNLFPLLWTVESPVVPCLR